MALVRVYFGLTLTEPSSQDAGRLAVAVVDDSGRLLDVCEITDDPAGYAELGAMFAERAGGPAGVSLAVDGDEHRVTLLLAAAGRPIAVADEDLVDDYAERFADDDAPEERTAAPAHRRAVGLARALQAGALVAHSQAPPRELVNLKPVLTAHAAMAAGRHAAATALREVLRELYPAALRAYPDPADPVPLAILDKLPEPGLLGVGSANRGREADVAAQLAAAGVADPVTLADAVTALRVAVNETPRRTGIGRSVTNAIAETVRQAISAVRACDNAVTALLSVLDVPAPARRAVAGPEPLRDGGRAPTPRRQAPTPTMASATPVPPSVSPPVVTPRVATPPPDRPAAGPAPAAAGPAPAAGPSTPLSPIPRRMRTTPAAGTPDARRPGFPPPGQAQTYGYSAEYATVPAPAAEPPAPDAPASAPPAPRPASAPPGSRTDWPLSPRTGDDAAASAQAGRRRAPSPDRPDTGQQRRVPAEGEGRRRGRPDLGVPPVPHRAEAAGPPAGRRATPDGHGGGPMDAPGRGDDGRMPTEGRVVPPWQSDDLPAEPAPLRLVEPAPIADRALRPGELRPTTPPLRLVDQNERAARADLPTRGTRDEPPTGRRRERREEPPGYGAEPPAAAAGPAGPAPARRGSAEAGGRRAARAAEREAASAAGPVSAPPVGTDDGDLLIFAETRSAWFTGQFAQIDWSNPADEGWRAAELAAEPQTTDETIAGLPKRVPKANLVPGSATGGGSGERPLRIVRDPAAMAAHTTGYFRGSRRGEEVRGYAVGGRPGRDSASGWDFSREGEEPSWEGSAGSRFRSAARR